jgi:plastocyanin
VGWATKRLAGWCRARRGPWRTLLVLALLGGAQQWPGALAGPGEVEARGVAAPLAATAPVTIVDFAFQPLVVTINVGDQVTWTNTGGSFHTSTSDTGVWDSGTLTPSQSFSFTFNAPGSFLYHCSVHPFMTGTVDVQAATSTPTRTPTSTPTITPALFTATTTRTATATSTTGIATATSTRTATPTAFPVTAQWQATVGAQTPDKAIQALAFFPHDLTVDVGDRITWAWQADEVHTLTFLQAGQTPPAFQTAPATPDNFVYHGTEFVNSGARTQANPPYSVVFATPGTFTYVCLVHASMTATVQVNAAGTPYPHDQGFYDTQAAQERSQDLANGQTISAQSLQAALAAPNHVTAGGGDAAVFVARFQPSTIAVSVGQTVTWTNPDSFTPHTVTFGNVAGAPQNASGTDRPGHATISANPPAPGVNSGFIGAGRPLGTDFSVTFTTPGTYQYICLLHVDLGMTGSVTVQAATVTPTATTTAIGPPVGTTFHAVVISSSAPSGGVTLSPMVTGSCPRPLDNCVELTVTGSFTVTGTVRGLSPGIAPLLLIPVSDAAGQPAGIRQVTCGPADSTGTATCNAAVAEARIFPTVGGVITAVPSGTVQVTTAPTNNVAQLLATLPVTGGGPCALLVGDACQVAGAVNGSGQVIASMRWALAVPAGVVPVGAAANVFLPTTAGLESFVCVAAAAGAATSCAGTTNGNGLQGGTVSVFAGGVQVATGVIAGAGLPNSAVPLLPPPLLLPLPQLHVAPLLLPPPAGVVAAPGLGVGALPAVPVVPEADSGALVGVGLLALGAWLGWRRRRRAG